MVAIAKAEQRLTRLWSLANIAADPALLYRWKDGTSWALDERTPTEIRCQYLNGDTGQAQ